MLWVNSNHYRQIQVLYVLVEISREKCTSRDDICTRELRIQLQYILTVNMYWILQYIYHVEYVLEKFLVRFSTDVISTKVLYVL